MPLELLIEAKRCEISIEMQRPHRRASSAGMRFVLSMHIITLRQAETVCPSTAPGRIEERVSGEHEKQNALTVFDQVFTALARDTLAFDCCVRTMADLHLLAVLVVHVLRNQSCAYPGCNM